MEAGQPNVGGRPPKYSREAVQRVCERMATGMSLRRACVEEDFTDTAFLRWVFAPDFQDRAYVSEQYEQARVIRTERLLDETIEIADESDPERVQVDRLRCDVRDKALARMSPKRYADLKKIEHSGGIERRKRIILDDGTAREG
jgi:hypothetical protein